MIFKGTAGDDNFTGTNGDDQFALFQGGDDTAVGGSGKDGFNLKGTLTAADKIDGGTGHDTVVLAGDYSSGVTFAATTMTNVEFLRLGAGYSYKFTTDDATVGAGAKLFVDASALGSSNSLMLDGSGETDGRFKLTGGAGNDTLTGGAINDLFDLTLGGDDVAHGGGGADVFKIGTQQLGSDQIDGGAGADTVIVTGNATSEIATFGPQTLTNVETLKIAGPRFSFTTNDATVAAGAILTVQSSSPDLTFDGSAETDGRFSFVASGGAKLTGGALSDQFDVRNATSVFVTGGNGNDTIRLNQTGVVDGGAGDDHIFLYGGHLSGGIGSWTSVEKVTLVDDVDSVLDLSQIGVSAAQTFTVDGRALTTHSLSIQEPLFSGDIKVLAGGGDDTIVMNGALTGADSIDGGAGSNAVTLVGDYSGGLTMSATTLTNVQTLNLTGDHTYNLTMSNANVAAGQQLWVNDGSHKSNAPLTLDASAETSGSYKVWATSGDDSVTTGGGADLISLFGGNDTANTGAGNDTIDAFLSSGDHIDGGVGTDEFDVNSADASVTAGFFNIEKLVLTTGIDLTTTDANVTKGIFTLDGHQMTDSLVLDASAETSNTYHVMTSADAVTDDTITTGGGADTVDLGLGNDTVSTGAGNDTINITTSANADSFTAADSIDGGAGSDTVVVTAAFPIAPVTFTDTTMTNVETLRLLGPVDYTLQTADATVAAGAKLTVDASALAGKLVFDGSLETDGRFTLVGGSDDDTLTGGAGADSIDLSQGGNDTAHGGGGDDVVVLGSALNAGDTIDGGTGSDRVTLGGDYASFVFGATTMTNVETLQLLAGHNYNLTTNDGTVAAGDTLTVSAKVLGAGESVTFDGSAESDGAFSMTGGAGGDTFTGGTQGDTFDLTQGGVDTVHAGGGDDAIRMGGAFTAADAIDGGAGQDTVFLNGDYTGGNALTLGATTIVDVETLVLGAGHKYDITTDGATVAAGQSLAVDATALGASDSATFDGSAETNGFFAFKGGAGDDTLTGGAQSDTFDLTYGGNDTVDGGNGSDTFNLGAALTAADAINGGLGLDTLNLNGDYSAGVVLAASTLTGVETISFAAGHSYDITTDDANFGPGVTIIDGDALGAGDSLRFNGAAETDGSFLITGGAGDDVLIGGSHSTFALANGGNDSVTGGSGSDTIYAGASLTAADTIDGGGGSDTLNLDGDYSAGIVLAATTLTGVEILTVAGGHNYKITTDDANVASGATLTVDASALNSNNNPTTARNSLNFDGSAETDGNFVITGGTGNDVIAGGTGADTFNGGTGGNTIHGNGGDDTLIVTAGSAPKDDQFFGDGGFDTVDYSAITGNVQVFLTTGNASAAFSTQTLSSIEKLILGSGTNHVVLNEATLSETIDGGTGSTDVTIVGAFVNPTQSISAPQWTNIQTIEFSGVSGLTSFQLNGDVTGGGGNLIFDALSMGSAAVVFDLRNVTTSTVQFGGSAGNDTIEFGVLDTTDTFNGRGGSNTLSLHGDYSAGYTFAFGQLTNIQTLKIDLTSFDASLTANSDSAALAVVGTGSHNLTFNGASEGVSLSITSGSGDDTLTGGSHADTFDLSAGGTDYADGGAGNDVFNFGAAFTFGDTIVGGTGNDTLTMDGDYANSQVLDSYVTGIETILFEGSTSVYQNAVVSGDVTDAGTLTVDASGAESISLDMLFATSATNIIIGSSGNDAIFLSDLTNTITAGLGKDTIYCAGASDTFVTNAIADSTSAYYDTLDSTDFSGDHFNLAGAHSITTVNNVVSFSVNTATLDADIAAAANGNLGANTAVTIIVAGGTLAGQEFLVVSGDGDNAYTAGSDYLFDVPVGAAIDTSSFI